MIGTMIEALAQIETRDCITIAAVLLGPVLAVWAGNKIREKSERRGRQIQIYRALYMARNCRFSRARVEALNSIEIDFSEKIRREVPVLHAVRNLLAQLHRTPNKTPYDEVWEQVSEDLYDEVLLQLSIHLGYSVNKGSLQSSSYYPKVMDDTDVADYHLKQLLCQLIESSLTLEILPKQKNEPNQSEKNKPDPSA